MWSQKWVLSCAHLILQVHLGPTGEEELYHISMTPDTGPHAGSHAILKNRIRSNRAITEINWKQTGTGTNSIGQSESHNTIICKYFTS